MRVGARRVVRRRREGRPRRRRCRRGDAPDRPAIEVDVVEIPLGAELEVDRVRRPRDEGGQVPGRGLAVPTLGHDPDAVA